MNNTNKNVLLGEFEFVDIGYNKAAKVIKAKTTNNVVFIYLLSFCF